MLLPIRSSHDRCDRCTRRCSQHRNDTVVFGIRSRGRFGRCEGRSRAGLGLWVLRAVERVAAFGLDLGLVMGILRGSCDAIRRTTSAPPGQITRQGKTPKRASAAPSHHSNAPIRQESQSILSKIVAPNCASRGVITSCSIKPNNPPETDLGEAAVLSYKTIYNFEPVAIPSLNVTGAFLPGRLSRQRPAPKTIHERFGHDVHASRRLVFLPWSREFDDPTSLPGRRELLTLCDAGSWRRFLGSRVIAWSKAVASNHHWLWKFSRQQNLFDCVSRDRVASNGRPSGSISRHVGSTHCVLRHHKRRHIHRPCHRGLSVALFRSSSPLVSVRKKPPPDLTTMTALALC